MTKSLSESEARSDATPGAVPTMVSTTRYGILVRGRKYLVDRMVSARSRRAKATLQSNTDLWKLMTEAAAGTTDSPFQAMKFHEALVQLSGNHTLSAFLMVLHEIHEGVAVALSQESRSAARSNRTIETHKALVELIKAGDGAGAEALWHDYWEWITPFTHPEAAVVNVLQKLETSE